jgi:sulfatase maturation enzyme AslB (radical SAM superfamily)
MITYINLDPNGLCNAKCWFCPVAYVGNSKENKMNMPIETVENVFRQLNEGRGTFVTLGRIYNSPIHFNEVLLYPYFEEMLELHRKYNIGMRIYTNGVNLTTEKINLIKSYKDVVEQVALNIPSLNAKQWSEFTGFNVKIFSKLLENLKYAEQELTEVYGPDKFYIMANGVNEKSLFKNGGWIDVLENAPKYDMDVESGTLAKIVEEMKFLFPRINVWGRNNLGDRTSILDDLKIISNQSAIQNKSSGKVIGCGTGYDEGINISAAGNVFVCCIDFNYETAYANINQTPLKDIWQTLRRPAIKQAYEGLCKNCLHAIRESGTEPAVLKVL